MKSTLRFGFVGAGKVGQTFGQYLYAKGFSVLGYYSKTLHHAEIAAKQVNAKAYLNLTDLVMDSDVLMITVNDHAIAEVAEQIADIDYTLKPLILVHMSGAMTSAVLSNALTANHKAHTNIQVLSVHPMQAFAKVEDALHQMPETIFSFEGDEGAVDFFKEVFKMLGNDYLILTEAQKVKYHLAAVIVSNYLVTLTQFGLDQLSAIGISDEIGLKALLPLVKGTLTNISTLGTHQAMTGPIVRGDSDTVKAHLNELEDEAKALYKLLGRLTLKLVDDRIENEEQRLALKTLLKEE